MGFLPDKLNCGLRTRRECRKRFPRHHRVNNPDMHHGTCVTHVPGCMPGLLTSVSFEVGSREKGPRHCRRMRNPQFYVSGKRLIRMSYQVIQKTKCALVISCESVSKSSVWDVDSVYVIWMIYHVTKNMSYVIRISQRNLQIKTASVSYGCVSES